MEPYDLIATSVTSSLGIRIREIFPGMTWYRETVAVQNLVFPHWFIHQLTLDVQPERQNHWYVNYLATMRYRHVSDPALSISGLQEALDGVSIKLLSELETIDWNGIPVMVKNLRTEKVDGVLHAFCNINVMATKPLPEIIKLAELEVKTNIREE